MKDEHDPNKEQDKEQLEAQTLTEQETLNSPAKISSESVTNHEDGSSTSPPAPRPMPYFLEVGEKLASIFANALVIFGIIFAGLQYCQTERLDKKQVALATVAAAKSPELLGSIKRLKILSEPIIEQDTTRLLKLFFSDKKTDSEDTATKAALFVQIDSAYLRAYQSPENWAQVADDFNLVFARYNETARLYYYDLGDRTIIGESMKGQVSTFYNILIRWPFLMINDTERHDGTTLKRFLDLVNSSQKDSK